MRACLVIVALVVVACAAPCYSSAIVNGGFESGLDGWSYTGNVEAVTFGDAWAAPPTGDYMAKIGADVDPGLSWPDSALWQSFEVPENGVLTFDYAFFSWDSLGYDDPGLVVKLDDDVILQESAPVEYNEAGPYTTGWRTFTYGLAGRTGTATLAFCAGNSDLGGELGDTDYESWAYLDNVGVAPGLPAFVLLGAAPIVGGAVRRLRRK